MTHYLLDTDTIIEYLAGNEAVVSLIQDIHAQGRTLCTCAVVLAEIYAGLYPHVREPAEQLLTSLEFLPIGPAAAQQAGEWRYDFGRRGITLTTTDCLIAATARAHGAAVVTGNVKDYPMGVTVIPHDVTGMEAA